MISPTWLTPEEATELLSSEPSYLTKEEKARNLEVLSEKIREFHPHERQGFSSYRRNPVRWWAVFLDKLLGQDDSRWGDLLDKIPDISLLDFRKAVFDFQGWKEQELQDDLLDLNDPDKASEYTFKTPLEKSEYMAHIRMNLEETQEEARLSKIFLSEISPYRRYKLLTKCLSALEDLWEEEKFNLSRGGDTELRSRTCSEIWECEALKFRKSLVRDAFLFHPNAPMELVKITTYKSLRSEAQRVLAPKGGEIAYVEHPQTDGEVLQAFYLGVPIDSLTGEIMIANLEATRVMNSAFPAFPLLGDVLILQRIL